MHSATERADQHDSRDPIGVPCGRNLSHSAPVTVAYQIDRLVPAEGIGHGDRALRQSVETHELGSRTRTSTLPEPRQVDGGKVSDTGKSRRELVPVQKRAWIAVEQQTFGLLARDRGRV